MRFLVVGCGSIGERHLRNLQGLHAGEVLACDVDQKRLDFIEGKYGVRTFANPDQALDQQIDALLVCVPPSLHIPLAAKGLEHGAHLFIEKPLSHSLEGVDAVLEQATAKRLVILVGYNLRFHPSLKLVKQFLDEGRIGKVLSARVEVGQYLPDWHPWQDYREMYVASKQMGGGIILDGSHELDYIRWFLGEVAEVSCLAGKTSSLDVETEDTAEILLRFASGAIAGVHLDFVQRAYSRSCKIIGEEGTALWDFGGKVGIYTAKSARWEETKLEVEPNSMYVEEMKHFVSCVRGDATPSVSGGEAKRVLEIALAAKKSAKTGRKVKA